MFYASQLYLFLNFILHIRILNLIVEMLMMNCKCLKTLLKLRVLLLLMLLLVVILVIGLSLLVLVVKEFLLMLEKKVLLRKLGVIALRCANNGTTHLRRHVQKFHLIPKYNDAGAMLVDHSRMLRSRKLDHKAYRDALS